MPAVLFMLVSCGNSRQATIEIPFAEAYEYALEDVLEIARERRQGIELASFDEIYATVDGLVPNWAFSERFLAHETSGLRNPESITVSQAISDVQVDAPRLKCRIYIFCCHCAFIHV